MKRIEHLIQKLNLQEHPEGGFYKETYRSEGLISLSQLPQEFSGDRNYCTGIYFLLTADNFSAFHRINQDEMWHYYEGSPLVVHMIDQQGNYSFQKIGLALEDQQVPQFVVPKGIWFASEVLEPNAYSLVGCTVSPGFDFADFELANREELIAEYPNHANLIFSLTRK